MKSANFVRIDDVIGGVKETADGIELTVEVIPRHVAFDEFGLLLALELPEPGGCHRQHFFGAVEADDLMPMFRYRERQRSGAASEIKVGFDVVVD